MIISQWPLTARGVAGDHGLHVTTMTTMLTAIDIERGVSYFGRAMEAENAM